MIRVILKSFTKHIILVCCLLSAIATTDLAYSDQTKSVKTSKARLKIAVVDSNNIPVAEPYIQIGAGKGAKEFTGSAAGELILMLPPGKSNIVVGKDNYISSFANVVLSTAKLNDIKITLLQSKRYSDVALLVVDQFDNNISNATLAIQYDGLVQQHTVPFGGNLSLQLPTEMVHITGNAPGHISNTTLVGLSPFGQNQIQLTLQKQNVQQTPQAHLAAAPEKLIRLEIDILDKSNNKPIASGQIQVQTLNAIDQFDGGYWSFVTTAAFSTGIEINAPGYEKQQADLDFNQQIKQIVYLQPIPVEVSENGDITIREKIVFAVGSSRISKVSFEALDRLVELIRNRMPNKKIHVVGYTDNRGSRASNIRLSDRRANSIMQYIIEKGLAPDNITSEGKGPDNPIASNTTAKGREKNRRVEFHLRD